MIVVSDATPLHYLILIGQDKLLPALFNRVVVPRAVFDELQRDRTPEPVKAWIGNAPGWLEVRHVTVDPGPPPRRLGRGEWEAIAIAEELKADLLLIDDQEGRREAQRRSLLITGTLGVLDRAAACGLIDLAETIARLQQTSFYLSNESVRALLERRFDK